MKLGTFTNFHQFFLSNIDCLSNMWLIILLFISIAFIIFTTSKLKWHPFFSLLIAAFGYGGLSGTLSLEEVVKSVNSGFGNTIGFIGIVILAGSIIGKFLEKSGGAFTLAGSTLKIVGKKNVPLALSIIGYIVSIPVFCDSGFIIIAPFARALVVVALGAGGMIASHANDSYFWVVTQMSNMSVNQGYKLQTLGTLTVGIFSSLAVWLLSLIIL